jgi:hypothetical protein
MTFRSRALHLMSASSALGFAAILMSGFWAPSAGAAEGCQSGIGQWSWFIGGEVTLSQGGAVRWVPGTVAIPPANGRWTCDPKVGKYVVTWQNGFVDTLSLSADGARLTGKSSTGVAVSGWRGAPAAAPAAKVASTGIAPVSPIAPVAPVKAPGSGAIDHNPSVAEILKGRPKLDPRGWKPGSRPPQKGPKPFEGWDSLIQH